MNDLHRLPFPFTHFLTLLLLLMRGWDFCRESKGGVWVGGDCKSIIPAIVTAAVIISSFSQLCSGEGALCEGCWGTIRWRPPIHSIDSKSFPQMMMAAKKNFPLHWTQFVIKSFIITHEWVQLILTSFCATSPCHCSFDFVVTHRPSCPVPSSCVAAFGLYIRRGSGHNFAVPFAISRRRPPTKY